MTSRALRSRDEAAILSRLARDVGTPTYVYRADAIRGRLQALAQAFASVEHLVCYSVKANPSLAILKVLAQGGAGFDIVSGGELARVRKAAGRRAEVVFSGVGKREDELVAALKSGVRVINVESREELELLDRVGLQLGVKAPFALRVNPDVDPRTHRHVATGLKSSKFGVAFDEALALYRRSRSWKGVTAVGVDCHIGSQLLDLKPLGAALKKVGSLYASLQSLGFELTWLDVGGGLGVPYAGESAPSVQAYADVVSKATRGLGARLILEPGRWLVAEAGTLLTRVLFRKRADDRELIIVDAGMNDLLRPALYDAFHDVVAVEPRRGPLTTVDVVGPVCESTDVLARDRRLPPLRAGDVLAIETVGAYGMAMASNYNARPRPAEVLLEGTRHRVVRRREAIEDLWRGETP